jgi:carboxypeptidase Q
LTTLGDFFGCGFYDEWIPWSMFLKDEKTMKLICLCLVTILAAVCSRPAAGQQEFDRIVAGYKPVADRIIETARAENDAWLKLQELCDDIGCRLSGSPQLDQAIQWAVQTLREDGHENVRTEGVTVRKWVRGDEYCRLVSPRPLEIQMLGLGGSVGTGAEGLTAEVVVVDSKEELDALPDEAVRGKIVVFNKSMPRFSETEGSGYGGTVVYRSNGARWAAERGGVAALVRSITAYSLDSPHTGAMRYSGGPDVPKIPSAAISVEGSTLLRRFQNRGIKPTLKLYMEAEDHGEVPSANVLAEIVGREKPEEIVVIGGHIDSWDVGTGAHDDGTGCVAAMEALNVIRKLGLQPRRTIRVVLWTNEENGIAGALNYLNRHQDEVHVAGIESDSGGFSPEGLSVEMQDRRQQEIAAEQLREILKLLQPINATRVKTGFSGVDVGQLRTIGTACMGLNVDGRLYFNTHHTHADTVDKVDPDQLTDCTITMAVAAWVLAEMPGRLGQMD